MGAVNTIQFVWSSCSLSRPSKLFRCRWPILWWVHCFVFLLFAKHADML